LLCPSYYTKFPLLSIVRSAYYDRGEGISRVRFIDNLVEGCFMVCYDGWHEAIVEISVLIDGEFEGCPEVSWLQGVAEQVLMAHGVSSNVELGLVIATQERVQQLNRSYLGRDEPTDVLAFSMLPTGGAPPFVAPPDGVLHLGEVVISFPQAVIQAEEHGHPVKREIAILIIHGVLHLLGYEDEKPELKLQMAAREEEILSYIETTLEK
jgi:probable rRNA maturation factor